MQMVFTRNNIDRFLYLIAKDYKKHNKYADDIEIILVGGASILLNYNFREQTMDLDAIIKASSSIKDSINRVGDDNNLANHWLNSDFVKTVSYSVKLNQYSRFYKRFCNCLNVRTVSSEYLIAMKIKSARVYKHDLSDIIGIVKEQQELQQDISYETIEKAYHELYGEDDRIPENMKMFLQDIFKEPDLEELFYSTKEEEYKNKQTVLKAEEQYGDVINDENIQSFIEHFTKD